MKLSLLKTALVGLAMLTFGCSNLKQTNMSASLNSSAPLATKPAAPEDKNAPGAYTIKGTPLKFKDTVQPTETLILCWDCDDPQGLKLKPEAAFDHTAHATDKKYSEDGTRVVGCAECHHTDQPSAPKGSEYLKKFQRDAVLTAENLSKQAVETCRGCHLRSADEPTDEYPPVSVEYPKDAGKSAGKDKSYNDEAYHLNCNTCHDQARKRADPKPSAKMPQKCDDCHSKKA